MGESYAAVVTVETFVRQHRGSQSNNKQTEAWTSCFIFRSRGGNRLEILTWDRDGYVLWYKRLEAGVFKLPRVAPGAGSVELRASELAILLDGIDMAKLKRVRVMSDRRRVNRRTAKAP